MRQPPSGKTAPVTGASRGIAAAKAALAGGAQDRFAIPDQIVAA